MPAPTTSSDSPAATSTPHVTLQAIDTKWRPSEWAAALLLVALAALVPGVYRARSGPPTPTTIPGINPIVPTLQTGVAGIIGGSDIKPLPPLKVDVKGAVNTPGVVTMASGSRVMDAIRLAGGALDQADLSLLNMALPLADGDMVIVPLYGEVTGGVFPGGGADGHDVRPASSRRSPIVGEPGGEDPPQFRDPIRARESPRYRREAGPGDHRLSRFPRVIPAVGRSQQHPRDRPQDHRGPPALCQSQLTPIHSPIAVPCYPPLQSELPRRPTTACSAPRVS
ncbi:MAG: SLBB domain-containing protein [bacterium]